MVSTWFGLSKNLPALTYHQRVLCWRGSNANRTIQRQLICQMKVFVVLLNLSMIEPTLRWKVSGRLVRRRCWNYGEFPSQDLRNPGGGGSHPKFLQSPWGKNDPRNYSPDIPETRGQVLVPWASLGCPSHGFPSTSASPSSSSLSPSPSLSPSSVLPHGLLVLGDHGLLGHSSW